MRSMDEVDAQSFSLGGGPEIRGHRLMVRNEKSCIRVVGIRNALLEVMVGVNQLQHFKRHWTDTLVEKD